MILGSGLLAWPVARLLKVDERYRRKPERVASIVLLGNLAAFAVMPIVLAFALR